MPSCPRLLYLMETDLLELEDKRVKDRAWNSPEMQEVVETTKRAEGKQLAKQEQSQV